MRTPKISRAIPHSQPNVAEMNGVRTWGRAQAVTWMKV